MRTTTTLLASLALTMLAGCSSSGGGGDAGPTATAIDPGVLQPAALQPNTGDTALPPVVQPTFESMNLRRAETRNAQEVCREEFIALNDYFVERKPDAIQSAREQFLNVRDIMTDEPYEGWGIDVHWVYPNSPPVQNEGDIAAENNSSGIWFSVDEDGACFTVTYEGFGLDESNLRVKRIFTNTRGDIGCFVSNPLEGSRVIQTFPLYQVGSRAYGVYARDLELVTDGNREIYRQIYQTRYDGSQYYIACPQPTLRP